MKTVSNKLVRYSLVYLSVQKQMLVDVPFFLKIWQEKTHPLQKRRFPIDILVAPEP